MKAKLCPKFDRDDYIEKLLLLRQSDAPQFLALPKAVIKAVEEYEREKELKLKELQQFV